MADVDGPDRPDNLVLWRIRALEEAVKYLGERHGVISENQTNIRSDLREIRRDYVSREELAKETRKSRIDGRERVMLWLVGLGTCGTLIVGVINLIAQGH